MQNILVPTDFSDNAIKAALYAGEIAKRNKAAIYLLHAMELGIDKLYQPFTLHEKYNHLLLEERKNKLETLRKSFSEIYNTISVESTLEDGTAVDSILDFCSFKNIDLVVMGTKGAGGLKEKLVGTVTASLVSKIIVPVLAIPEDYIAEKPDAILFTTHRFEKDKKLLAMIMELAKLFTARVDVVYFDDVESAQRKTANEQTRHMAEYIHFLEKNYKPVTFKGEILKGNDFETAIENYHASHKTDIAAMITYPKGFWEKVFQKSVTQKMVYHSTVPVLAIPAV
jgi:nucleotide-binding universal stress UspA family protein